MPKGILKHLKSTLSKKNNIGWPYIDLSEDPGFKSTSRTWGTRGDEKLRDIITLTAIGILSKTDIMAWDEAFDILEKAKDPSILAILQWAQPDWIIEAQVKGTGVLHKVVIDKQGYRCTCEWFTTYQGKRGIYKHILAVKMVAGEVG